MITTHCFGVTASLRDKVLDDTIPKLTCMIAVPAILMLSYMFLIYWYALHWFILRMPFPMIVPFLSITIVADYIIVHETGILR